MKINYTYVNPGGNPTILVTSKLSRKDYSKVAKKFLQLKDPPCEQVGFLEAPRNPKAEMRVQMMGGEFCANALRSTASMLALDKAKYSLKKSFSFNLESSGTNKIIRGRSKINAQGKVSWAEIEFPISKKQISIKNVALGKLVTLEGITHLVITKKLSKNNINYTQLIPKLYKLLKISNKAFGLIFCTKISKTKLKIAPIVYVPATESVIFETSCASGAIAAVLASGSYKQHKKISVLQPSKFWLEISANKSSFKIGGKISSIQPQQTH